MNKVISGIVEFSGEKNIPIKDIKIAPNNAATVPVGDMPPLVPAGTDLRVVILLVLTSNEPISEANVSDSATEILAIAAK